MFCISITVLLVFFHLPLTCLGQPCTLTTSSTPAVNGEPFTFNCTTLTSVPKNRYLYPILKVFFQTHSENIQPLQSNTKCEVLSSFNLTCDSIGTTVSLHIPSVDYKTLNDTGWRCICRGSGMISNRVSLNVNVPMNEVSLLNATSDSPSLIEGDSFTVVCETSPSYPPSNITWVTPNQSLVQDMTSMTRDEDGLKVTIGILTMKAMLQYNEEEIHCIGHYLETRIESTRLRLLVKAPLTDVVISMNVTNDDTVTITCKTNPTYPPSDVVWMRGYDRLSGVTSQSREENGKTTTVCVLSASCKEDLNGVHCVGIYMEQNISSIKQPVFIQCRPDRKLSDYLLAGAGTGVAVCVFLLLVAALTLVMCKKRRRSMNPQNDAGVHSSRNEGENTYDKMDETTRQRDPTENYEEVKLYENTNAL